MRGQHRRRGRRVRLLSTVAWFGVVAISLGGLTLLTGEQPAAASAVTNPSVCITGIASFGGCDNTSNAATEGTHQTLDLLFQTVNALPGGDTITLSAVQGAAGMTFPTGEDGYQVNAGGGGCSELEPVSVANSGQTVTLDVPDSCPAPAGGLVEIFVTQATLPTTPSQFDYLTLSTSTDTTTVATNFFQVLAQGGSPASGSGVSRASVCVTGIADFGGCDNTDNVGSPGGSPSIDVLFQATSALSSTDTITVDAATGAAGMSFPNNPLDYQINAGGGGCTELNPVVLTNNDQTVTLDVPGSCPSAAGGLVDVLIQGETLPTSGGFKFLAVHTSEDPKPEATNFFTISSSFTTTPSPSSVTLGNALVTLTDSATLSGTVSASGTITFTLIDPNGTTVDTETATVSGNGTYSTPNGYALPTTATVVGSYDWHVSYSGDANNAAKSDNSEQVTVSQATPTFSTTPSPTTGQTGSSPSTLKDTATISGGYFPSGTITFTLFDPNGVQVHTETEDVPGNGKFTTLDGYTLPADSARGTYQWNASYSGDGNNAGQVDVGAVGEQVGVLAGPALTTTANTKTITLGSSTPPVMNDIATLSGGDSPSGTITFTLAGPNGTTVDTETATVTGNGRYTTPTGYTLGTSPAVGTYTWSASYGGDAANAAVSETDATDETTDVVAASPTITTTPSPTSATAGMSTTLTDTATLAGGFSPTGTITFTLLGPTGSLLDSETATVNGNGQYSTTIGYTLPTEGSVAGTYQWNATYSGDPDNGSAAEVGFAAERVTVDQATPGLTTDPGSPVTLGASPTTLTDTATLSAGDSPSGTITFTLVDPNGTTVDTETATVNGDGSFATPNGYTLPTSGTVVGTYQWNATYSGDTDNATVVDTANADEQVVVDQATPSLSTTAQGSEVLTDVFPVTLLASATLSGGYFPGGTLTFVLHNPIGDVVDTETVPVTGDGTYSTPTGFALAGPSQFGTYQWDSVYSGDPNNQTASDADSIAGQTTVGGFTGTSPPAGGGGTGGGTASSNPPIIRISGPDAVGTSIAISQAEIGGSVGSAIQTSKAQFPHAGSAGAVVLARSDFFSDALAGGPLAAAKAGPLLITPGADQSATLDPRVQTEIQRVLAPGGTVYVLGGDLALSPAIDQTLEGLGYTVVREAGIDEYGTAVDIAHALGDPTNVFEATGLSFYDALSAVPAAVEDHAAILLTDGTTQAPETAAYLAQHPGDARFAIGGPLAAAGADPSATPVYGQDLYATSVAVANRFFPGAHSFGAASSATFPDALGGGVFMATTGGSGPLLIVNPSTPVPGVIVAYLGTLATGTQGYVFGGPLAVGDDVLTALQAAIG